MSKRVENLTAMGDVISKTLAQCTDGDPQERALLVAQAIYYAAAIVVEAIEEQHENPS